MRGKSILDPQFHYVRAMETDVAITWRRFGFDPRRNAERRAQHGEADPGRHPPSKIGKEMHS